MVRPLSSEFSVQLGFSFNITLGRNLLFLRNAVMNQDFDAAIIIDGKEGSGKSVFAQQVATFLDCEHHLDLDTQICFTPDQFKHAVGNLKKGKAVIWDEARRGLNRRRFGSDVNLTITDMLAECRQHNLFMIIVMPSFYDMDLNVAIHRTRALIHVYYEWNIDDLEHPLQRGFFRFYNEDGKNELYANKYLRQRYKYPHIQNHSFDATFVHRYTVDETAYRERKRVAEADYRKARDAPQRPKDDWKSIVGNYIGFLSRNRWLKSGAINATADYFKVGREAITDWTHLPLAETITKPRKNAAKTAPERPITHKDEGDMIEAD